MKQSANASVLILLEKEKYDSPQKSQNIAIVKCLNCWVVTPDKTVTDY